MRDTQRERELLEPRQDPKHTAPQRGHTVAQLLQNLAPNRTRRHQSSKLRRIFNGSIYLDGEEPEYLRANARDDVVADGERAVSVGLPELHELLAKLLAHLQRRGGAVRRRLLRRQEGEPWRRKDQAFDFVREKSRHVCMYVCCCYSQTFLCGRT